MKYKHKTKRSFYFRVRFLTSVVVAAVLTIICQSTNAQSIVHRMYFFSPGIVATASIGTSVAFTDVKQNMVFPALNPKNEWRVAEQLCLEYEIIPIFSIRGQVSYSYVAGSRPTSDLFFEAKLLEGNINLIANPIYLFTPYRSDHKWFPTIIGGIGLLHYNSRLIRISTNETIASRGYGNAGGLWGYVIEGIAFAGVGLKYKIDEHWGIQFETSNRWMNSDKFDIVESVRTSPYDFYNLTTIGVSYKFFKTRTYPPERPK